MIVATLYIHGHGRQINWAEWKFIQLPSPGDIISFKDIKGSCHFARVRETTYVGCSIHFEDGIEPTASITADWMESYPSTEEKLPQTKNTETA